MGSVTCGEKMFLPLVKRSFASAASSSSAPSVVLIDGIRIPFTLAGTAYKDYLAVDLGRLAMKGLLDKTAISPQEIDYVYYGTVIQEPRTSNIAREAALGAGLPFQIPGHTVTQACISANQVRHSTYSYSFCLPSPILH